MFRHLLSSVHTIHALSYLWALHCSSPNIWAAFLDCPQKSRCFLLQSCCGTFYISLHFLYRTVSISLTVFGTLAGKDHAPSPRAEAAPDSSGSSAETGSLVARQGWPNERNQRGLHVISCNFRLEMHSIYSFNLPLNKPWWLIVVNPTKTFLKSVSCSWK